MSDNDLLVSKLFGILFVSGNEGVTEAQFCEVLNCTVTEVRDGLIRLDDWLTTDTRSPLKVMNFNGSYQLLTKSSLQSEVEAFAQLPLSSTLSRSAIETLAIIAYRQPVTRVQIEEVRGVASSHLIQKLLMRDLIQEVGRVEGPGRPILYGVTDYFMDYFGLEDLSQLPDIVPLTLNDEEYGDELFNMKQWQLDEVED